MKKVITFDFSMLNFFKALNANKEKVKDPKRQHLGYIYFDAKNSCFVATDGKALIKVNATGENLISQFEGQSAFCTLMNDSTLIAEDTYNSTDSQYVDYARVIPNVEKNYDRYNIPDMKKNWGISKKYVPFMVNQLISREADTIYNPEFFDRAKDIIGYMTVAFYPHIETWEEEEARLEAEKKMSVEERNNAKERRKNLRYMPTVLMSQDETITYVIMPIGEEGEEK